MVSNEYSRYIGRKRGVIFILVLLLIITALWALNTGSIALNPVQVLKTLITGGNQVENVAIWNIRLPRILAGLVAGAGLSVAGCVMQNNLRNPLASPSTLGISNAAAFGANVAIILLGAGTIANTGAGQVIINNPYMVTILAFLFAMLAALLIVCLAKFGGFTPEAIVLAGVALGSLFTAGTTIIQYFAEDVKVAAVVFWTFGDLGRAAWNEVFIMLVLVTMALGYFFLKSWDYNAISSGEETARGLGVNVDRVRMAGMLVASLITAVAVSFLGIIAFIGLIGPQIMRRIIGDDHRFLIPSSALLGSLILLAADTVAKTVIAPVVLPVGAVTSFLGAPLFLYLLVRGYNRK
ncbi:MAG TPA: iron ABC transporter permease [Syntrophomonadaceae bacterium]|jgi:iron complex transport system permease protein|nr:iron ABC transporter permease [Syntrophomonadaceae bacterium]HQA07317.1 iron ABC transporter permease [Syntrophomonadaceae bacterium]HQE23704.1 iron ABC transporter permease [Syntrophomonadaceae bacterium]